MRPDDIFPKQLEAVMYLHIKITTSGALSPGQVFSVSLCGIFYFPWHRHQAEGINSHFLKTQSDACAIIARRVNSQTDHTVTMSSLLFMKSLQVWKNSQQGLCASSVHSQHTHKPGQGTVSEILHGKASVHSSSQDYNSINS